MNLQVHGIFVLAVTKMKRQQRAVRVNQVDKCWANEMLLHKRCFRVIIRISADLSPPSTRSVTLQLHHRTVMLNAAFEAIL